VTGAVLYPEGSWNLHMAGALLAAAIALAGMAEFILLGSERFVSTPSAPAYGPDRGGDHRNREAPDQR
jgi:hypothetical protein